MPTKRRKRSRQRLDALSPAELQWLTERPQPDANEFELVDLELPIHRKALQRRSELLEQYADLVRRDRLADLEREQAELLEQLNRRRAARTKVVNFPGA